MLFYKIIKSAIIVDGEYVTVNYTSESMPFERIRHITGCLAGTTAEVKYDCKDIDRLTE